jgi:hypothetical protein
MASSAADDGDERLDDDGMLTSESFYPMLLDRFPFFDHSPGGISTRRDPKTGASPVLLVCPYSIANTPLTDTRCNIGTDGLLLPQNQHSVSLVLTHLQPSDSPCRVKWHEVLSLYWREKDLERPNFNRQFPAVHSLREVSLLDGNFVNGWEH